MGEKEESGTPRAPGAGRAAFVSPETRHVDLSDGLPLELGGQLPELGHWTYILLALLVMVEGPIATLLGAAAASAGTAGWAMPLRREHRWEAPAALPRQTPAGRFRDPG